MSNRFFPPQLHLHKPDSRAEAETKQAGMADQRARQTSRHKMAVVSVDCTGVLVVVVNFGVHRALRTSYRVSQGGKLEEEGEGAGLGAAVSVYSPA
ncbi:hypothetical protein Pmani_017530 [Petrolisthes manimaculis]|uniref:Uncharacterized protein n=1 Tax=Petrolisthes manimaculis TaxID=1843537 RepID=A0AAE1PMU5_9EUCA|nr:hypothetical protein Pmani_017530 [Petrolisthes manimaculis]